MFLSPNGKNQTMLIQPYQKSWADDFNTLKSIIHEALPNLTVAIEHVGSTSIPGLAAKPIIDMDIVFDKSVAFNKIKTGLATLGYYHNGNQGIAGREAFKRNPAAAKHEILDFITHHLYACRTDSEELNKHILFRDWLVTDADARNKYQTLKYAIAEEANQDKKRYAELKETKAADFTNGIIEKAKKRYAESQTANSCLLASQKSGFSR